MRLTDARTFIRSFLCSHPREHFATIGRDRNRVLEMRRQAAIRRYRRPAVFQYSDARIADVHHRLDCQHHTLGEPRAAAWLSVVRNLRLFVQLRTDAMADKLA